MIKIIEGDLFNSDAKYICHQVNCQSKMGSGVALQVRKKYPHVYVEYTRACSPTMLGDIQIVPINNNQSVVNMFAQNNYGYDGKMYTSLEAFESCLNRIKESASIGDSIAMPYKIGCCRGGADWNTVYNMIERILNDYDVQLWKYDKG